MTKSKLLIVAAMALMLAGTASADVVDPQIIIRSLSGAGSIQLNSLNFLINPVGESLSTQDPWPDCFATTFQTAFGPLGGYTCEVRNVTGVSLTSILFTFGGSQGPLLTGNTFTCGDLFANCTDVQGGNTSVLFNGGVIPNNGLFFVDFIGFSFGNPNNANDPSNTLFTVQSNVPEPATLGLGLMGIAALLGLRKLRPNGRSR